MAYSFDVAMEFAATHRQWREQLAHSHSSTPLCMYVCVCVCEREREREWVWVGEWIMYICVRGAKNKHKSMNTNAKKTTIHSPLVVSGSMT